MSDNEANDSINVEVERLNKFVDVAPQNDYNIDQNSQTLCRQLSNGQEQCVKINLEYAQMFSQMQKLGFFCALPMDPTETHMECRRI
ncbi:hypothetical protein DFQ28_002758 [Apophysomyces sp. BC1034]|nr:hypothetical protein DFQ30_005783 [Apophysomyces sp. BC1015]KAG0182587.1 hypothetical protein DFQ29_003367 [Apophysomyces sp. BC1021]KAG0193883.1 hypothetical protein DFQ28_002758 [Apophysomyces sp. BC1034]